MLSICWIISYRITSHRVVDLKWPNSLKVGTDKPKLKVRMQSVSYDDVRKRLLEKLRFELVAKGYSDWEDVTSCGKVFQIFGPAFGKARSPTVSYVCVDDGFRLMSVIMFFQYYFIWFSMFVVVYQCHSVFDLLSYQMCSLQPDSINYQWPNMCLSYFTAGTNSHSVIQLISRWLNCCYYYEHVYLPKP